MPSGASYEALAKQMLVEMGFNKVRKAPLRFGYDLEAEMGGRIYAIEVKGVGDSLTFSTFHIRWEQLRSLARAHKLGKQPLVAMLNKEGQGIVWEPFYINMDASI
jgi:Holliday junction resolvase